MTLGADCTNKKELYRALFAEFLGMTLFVFAGCGAILSSGESNNMDGMVNNTSRLMPIAMSFGIGAVVILYCIAGISGGHMNPAVTFFLMCCKKVSPGRAGAYIAVQMLGGIVGALILWMATSETGVHPYSLGATHLIDRMTGPQGFLLEFMGTLLLCLTVLFTEVKVGGPTDGKPNLSLLCIGLSIFVAHIVLVPFTGCGINPARTFGPSLVGVMVEHVSDSEVFFGEDCWIYYLGPIAGALAATGCYHIFDEEEEEKLMAQPDSQSEL
jgi:MIP family channel proteins